MSFELIITDYGSFTDPLPEGYVTDIITLEDAKNYLKQDYTGDTTEDALIQAMIQAARRWVEQHIGWMIIKKGIVAYTSDELDVFSLPMPPIQTISKAEKVLLNGTVTEMTLNSDYYVIGLTDKKLVLYKTWSTTSSQLVGVKVTYTAYMDEVPETLKDAVRALVAEMYVNRGDASPNIQRVPFGILEKLKPFRRLTL